MDQPRAVTPARPIRFGIADLWLLTVLIAVQIAAVIKLLQYTLAYSERELAEKVVLVALLCTVTVAGSAYLAFRSSTESQIASLWSRTLLVVKMEALVVLAIPLSILALYIVMRTWFLWLPLLFFWLLQQREEGRRQ